jgi:hypothetical protein
VNQFTEQTPRPVSALPRLPVLSASPVAVLIGSTCKYRTAAHAGHADWHATRLPAGSPNIAGGARPPVLYRFRFKRYVLHPFVATAAGRTQPAHPAASRQGHQLNPHSASQTISQEPQHWQECRRPALQFLVISSKTPLGRVRAALRPALHSRVRGLNPAERPASQTQAAGAPNRPHFQYQTRKLHKPHVVQCTCTSR